MHTTFKGNAMAASTEYVDADSLGVAPVTGGRLAERVASELRRRVVDGELADGARLPKEDTLRSLFAVGKPAIREALRILETEGLISVVRGNKGGAIVRVPSPSGIAYSLGMVLTFEDVEAGDLAIAVREIELLCAGLCAQRPDRATTVVPRLRAIHDRSVEMHLTGDSRPLLRSFHEELAASCGRRTLTILAGCLETLWTGHVRAETGAPATAVGVPGPDRSQSIAEHSMIIDAIEAGDVQQAQDLLRAHLERVQEQSTTIDLSGPIDILDHPIAAPSAR
jgi:DNA-binding FadR family transcriptional regulator